MNKFIFSSSAAVYGLPQNLPIDERHSTLPTNPYGRTKLYIERLLQDLNSSFTLNRGGSRQDWSIISLRYFNPVGAHESGLLGERKSGVPNNLMPYVARVASGREKVLNIYGNKFDTSDGTGVRDYIHISDLADAHCAAVKWTFNNRGYEFCNIGTGVGHSVLEMVKTFERVNRVVVPYEVKEPRVGDVGKCYANVNKAKEILEWTSNRSVEEMCESLWNWELLNSIYGK